MQAAAAEGRGRRAEGKEGVSLVPRLRELSSCGKSEVGFTQQGQPLFRIVRLVSENVGP